MTTLITTALLLASCSSTSAPSAAPTTTTPAVPAAAIPAVSTAAAGLAHDAIEFGDSGLELDRPADWRALDDVPSTMGMARTLTNGPAHEPCTTAADGSQTCGSPVDGLAPGQMVVLIGTGGGAAPFPRLVSEQLERLPGERRTVGGRTVVVDRAMPLDRCLPGAERAVGVAAPAELAAEAVFVTFCWRGPGLDTLGAQVDAVIDSITLGPVQTGLAVPSFDHWPVAGTGVGWELRAQAMPGPFECVLLTIDGQPTANACFRLADAGTAPVLPVQVGLTQTFDGKRFAYGVIEGADTPAVLDADPPVAVAALAADGGVRVFVTPVDRWATGGCETFTLLDALGVTRPGERPTVLPPVCRGDEADLYLLTHSSVNEDGRMVTFRRNADGMWRVAFDPWGVQSG